MNKDIVKTIRTIAKGLPVTYQDGEVFRIISGEELLRMGINERGNGKPVYAHSQYKYPIQQKVNHARRLRRLYATGGIEAMKEYVKQVEELVALKPAIEIKPFTI